MKNEAFRQVHQYSNPAPVLIFRHTKGRNTGVDAHWHNDLEINFVSKGQVRFYVGGQKKDRSAGGVCLAGSGEVHSAAPVFEGTDENASGITLLIQHDFLTSVIPNYDRITFADPLKREEEKIVAYLARIEELYEGQKDVSVSVRILGLVCQILSVLLEECAIEKDSVDVNYWKDSERQKIILDYIHLNYDQPLRQGELAEKFHFSREYFCRFFKRYTGQTFKEYLTGYRLTHAEQMLRSSGSSIVEIAHCNGFPDEQSFIRAFKNQYKESPGKYRKAWIER
jgi:AraC-like DNA-binding protein